MVLGSLAPGRRWQGPGPGPERSRKGSPLAAWGGFEVQPPTLPCSPSPVSEEGPRQGLFHSEWGLWVPEEVTKLRTPRQGTGRCSWHASPRPGATLPDAQTVGPEASAAWGGAAPLGGRPQPASLWGSSRGALLGPWGSGSSKAGVGWAACLGHLGPS